jgi:hypothetical protein
MFAASLPNERRKAQNKQFKKSKTWQQKTTLF